METVIKLVTDADFSVTSLKFATEKYEEHFGIRPTLLLLSSEAAAWGYSGMDSNYLDEYAEFWKTIQAIVPHIGLHIEKELPDSYWAISSHKGMLYSGLF